MKLIKSLLICLSIFPLELMAQPGALYPTFGTGGLVTSASTGSFDRIGVQPSGKIIVCRPGAAGTELLRYNADGTLDEHFGGSTNGVVWFGRFFQALWFAKGMGIQPDGKIVLLGAANGANGSNTLIFRLNEDGTTDGTFGNGGWTTADIDGFKFFASLTLDAAGKIIATGSYEFNANDDASLFIAKFNADGTSDLSFNGGGVRIVADGDDKNHMGSIGRVDGNGAITVFEEFGFQQYRFRRFLPNGHLDLTFGSNGEQGAEPMSDFDVDATGRIAYLRSSLHILNSNGSVAATENLPAAARVVRFQDNGKILVAGQVSQTNFWMERYADSYFGTNGEVVTNFGVPSSIFDIAIHNRRIYAAGNVRVPGEAVPYGAIAVYDGSDVRMSCPNVQSQYSVDAGKCYATVNNINAIMSSTTLWANVQHKLEYNGTTVEGEGGVSGKQFQLGTTHVTYSYTDITTQTCSFDITVTDQDAPVARCKNVTVQLDATGNGTLTAAQVNNGSTDGCGIQSMSLSKTSFNCSDPSSTTVTLTVTDVHDNSSTCNATITVEDNVPPVARCKNINVYLDATGNASITAAQIDNGSIDACGIKSYSLDKTTFNCSDKGSNTVTLTVTDNHDNSATCAGTVTVLDIIPPIISSVVPTPSAIWPSDRKMKNVSVATTSSDNCIVHSCRITGIAIKAGEFAGDNIGPDWEITSANTVNLRAEIPKKGVKRIYTVTVTCTDASNNSSTSTTDVIVAHNITSPISGATVRIGSTVNLSGEFWDVPGKNHTAKWLIDDKTINASVKEPSGMNSGAATGSYKFTAAGVYKLQMNITDQIGITSYANTSENLNAIIVVYDPNGGYTYGGGYYTSPAGALISNPSFTGDASYGFTVNYYKNASLPKGETQFEFKVGDFEFNALNFEYLVINNAMAQFKGTGKIIGGQSGVGFTMTVTDGQLDGSGIDKIRMKIYNKNNGAVIYDNQPGASDAALPTQAVGANSTIVISGANPSLTSANTNQKAEMEAKAPNVSSELDVIAFPNPSASNFSIGVKANSSKEKITMQVVDMYGRIIETRNVNARSPIRFGDRYNPGTYFVRILQGKEHKEIKLVKLSD